MPCTAFGSERKHAFVMQCLLALGPVFIDGELCVFVVVQPGAFEVFV